MLYSVRALVVHEKKGACVPACDSNARSWPAKPKLTKWCFLSRATSEEIRFSGSDRKRERASIAEPWLTLALCLCSSSLANLLNPAAAVKLALTQISVQSGWSFSHCFHLPPERSALVCSPERRAPRPPRSLLHHS